MTAYVMRISDWSSVVCSSDLKALGDPKPGRDAMRRGDFSAFVDIYSEHLATPEAQAALHDAVDLAMRSSSVLLCFERSPKECHRTMVAAEMEQVRSEEHTSELQSLMRISYAVFCLKNKTTRNKNTIYQM